jgi:hypothetical protein
LEDFTLSGHRGAPQKPQMKMDSNSDFEPFRQQSKETKV